MAENVLEDRRRSELVATLVDRKTREELRRLAEREDRSVSSILRRALVRELGRDDHEGGEAA